MVGEGREQRVSMEIQPPPTAHQIHFHLGKAAPFSLTACHHVPHGYKHKLLGDGLGSNHTPLLKKHTCRSHANSLSHQVMSGKCNPKFPALKVAMRVK